ncbi:lysosomal alpha-glucosidase-like protein [Lasius niger]|uniref:Lysosomal alpha-glucosidase-like protein n=1 Tax=Lasius niger TaxID=67767 RepID=A0A0J7KBC4_LASNI|nr:lysosomal alpha-glucosidase-like protein [Lasius niger]
MGVRIPHFWPEDPELWFAQAEGQFAICSIEDDNVKYAHVLSRLEPKQAREIKDVITHPPKERNNTRRQHRVRRAITNPVAGTITSTDASNPGNQDRRQPRQRGRASRQNTRRRQQSTRRSSNTASSSHTSNRFLGNTNGSAYKASRSAHHTNGEISKTNRHERPSESGKKPFKKQNTAGNA